MFASVAMMLPACLAFSQYLFTRCHCRLRHAAYAHVLCYKLDAARLLWRDAGHVIT